VETKTLAAHQRTPQCDIEPKRHNHPYMVGTNGYKRCSCGHRKYVITVGGALPPFVGCEKCGRENTTATCFERGLAAGRRQASVAKHQAGGPADQVQLVVSAVAFPGNTAWHALLASGVDPTEAWVLLRTHWEAVGSEELIALLETTPAGQNALHGDRAQWQSRGYPAPWDMVTA
jgi:hypothetical protein